METLKVNSTKSTPQVLFNTDKGILMIQGKSYMEDALEFYTPLIERVKWLSSKSINITLGYEYLNTSSTKCLLTLLKDIVSKVGEKNVYITWSHEEDDEDIIEVGQDFEDYLGIKFEFKELSTF